jgi:hypothetical protein
MDFIKAFISLLNPVLALILQKNKVLENEKPDKSSLKRLCPLKCRSQDSFQLEGVYD